MTYNLNPGEEDERQMKATRLEQELKAKLASAKTVEIIPNDPEKLEALHKLMTNVQGEPVQVQKMTTDEADVLRRTDERQHSIVVQQRRSMERFLGGFFTAIQSIFTKTEKSKTQCDNYGHVAPSDGKWQGAYPKCQRCGIDITSPEMLRKSVT